MKTKIIVTLVLIITTFSLSFSQKDSTAKSDEIRTICNQKKCAHGGYASLWGGYTRIGKQDGFSYGLNAAWMIGHSVGIGLAATGFSNDYYIGHSHGSNGRSLVGAYGGLLIEPVVVPKFPVHVSFPVVLGAGGVVGMNSYYWSDWHSDYYAEEYDLFLVAEPGIDIELNLLKHLRLAVGAKYRFTSGVKLEEYSSKVLDGYTISLSLKFGKF